MRNTKESDTNINLNKSLKSNEALNSHTNLSKDIERVNKDEDKLPSEKTAKETLSKEAFEEESNNKTTILKRIEEDEINTHSQAFKKETVNKLVERFRKFMPVVVDVETAGFNPSTDALLEIACIPILLNEQGIFYPGESLNAHLQPFEGANLEKRALEFTGIDPNNPMRKAIAEEEKPALRRIFKSLKSIRKEHECQKCILVGHNAHFDLSFLNAAIERTNSKNHNPFHQFSVLDTVTLSALAYGQTVLARACKEAGIDFSGSEAHSALYDTQKTAELFCHILNSYPMLQSAIIEENNADDSENGDESDKN